MGTSAFLVQSLVSAVSNLRAKSSIVSGICLKYSRFVETRPGDRCDRHCMVDVAVHFRLNASTDTLPPYESQPSGSLS